MFNCKKVPVPGTGRRRWRFGTCFKSPHTLAEARLSQPDPDVPPPRARRNQANLPTAWDDIVVRRQRSWKVFGKGCKAWDR